ncbi:hypothetical protein JCM10908_002038 [Rhodotorula pacifica]|uniref:uncharacterized protein n=1 Tax=Rhodotorula pacifica TaxID=1495444 RepID=UPI00317378E0
MDTSSASSDLEKKSSLQLEDNVSPIQQRRKLADIDPVAEAKLRRKLDRRILPVVAAAYLWCFIRANIGNARLAGLERDLGMRGYDYNILLTAFYVSYIVFELPCQMLTKWAGPGKTIPIFTFLFGLFSFAMAFVHTFGAAVAVRFLLGIAESSVFPSISFYLSRFYRRDELGFRLSCFLVCTAAAGAVGGLLASGILKIDSIGWLTRWRMIFFVEGIISMGVGIICWFFLSDSPAACKWLTPEERELAEFRLVVEQPGQHKAIDTLHSKAVWSGMFNANTIVIACIFLLNNITVQGVGFFLPTIVRSIYPEESTIQQQLRTVPPYVLGAFMTLFTGYLSWKTRRRGLYLVLSAPVLVAGFSLYVASLNPHVRYAAAHLVACGCFNFGAITTSWTAANVTSDTARAAAIGTMVAGGNIGGLIATWTFLPKDGPRYLPGNAFNLANSVVMFFLAGGLWMWQRRENKAKAAGRDDYRLEGKTESEIADLGQKHPDFRYAY